MFGGYRGQLIPVFLRLLLPPITQTAPFIPSFRAAHLPPRNRIVSAPWSFKLLRHIYSAPRALFRFFPCRTKRSLPRLMLGCIVIYLYLCSRLILSLLFALFGFSFHFIVPVCIYQWTLLRDILLFIRCHFVPCSFCFIRRLI
ncbi:hypothetical protein SERLADRAFT_477466 [Serpula lacrymans var. lacrymans S7.9]|uniref:Uncharacterized protein n=1 Tax=Serpula lacrymans var. lacrymans (strain S7.9) TaxID=578457 RepID=F8P911_SERL9|nr:uncharacterized protein SERLADRAFT_477466 [Serpula lacrymans var. lacrymans S7.9]EGO20140.1 hypothetical protein SERLADRAFT_477466 [Serpula lacrymans var. lacrymans S7.9]